MSIQTDYAFNGVECLQIMEKNYQYYSGIFMDINMPLMDGYETCK
jgi:CheY-like chemotaxis protein